VATAPPAAPAPDAGCVVNSGDWRTGQNHVRTMSASSNMPCSKPDYQPNGQTKVLSVTVLAKPQHGVVTPKGGGWTYQSSPNYRGPDTFAVAIQTNFGAAMFTYQVTVK